MGDRSRGSLRSHPWLSLVVPYGTAYDPDAVNPLDPFCSAPYLLVRLSKLDLPSECLLLQNVIIRCLISI
jgi:hypothetical protein